MLGWKRNDLRRRSDRIEIAMHTVLLTLLLVAGPILGWWASRSSYRADQAAVAWERSHVFRAEAVLVSEPEVLDAVERSTVGTRGAQATWTAPDGTPRSGITQVSPADRKGDRISIWVDARGSLRGPPLAAQPASHALAVAAAVILGVAAGLAGLRVVGLSLLNRHRFRAWQREWLEVGPRWSRDRR